MAILIPVIVFSSIVVLLAGIVLLARKVLSPSGTATITINAHARIEAAVGRKLLTVLAENGIYLPSACGGRGSCGQCRVAVTDGAPALLPNEAAYFSPQEALAGQRLACMLKIRGPLALKLPQTLLAVHRFDCTVASNLNLSTFLKELVLELPQGKRLEFEAGDYVMLEAPPYRLTYSDFDLGPDYRQEWHRLGLLELRSDIKEPTTRVYSLANPPQDDRRIVLVVRIAAPPASAAVGTPPGRVSSYLFGLKPGDTVSVSGPYGDFNVRETGKEMVLIGGGAGIAPLRSIILDQLARATGRKMSFWYGARDLKEVCYRAELEAAAAANASFEYHVALSDPRPKEPWDGPTGFIHTVVQDLYLKNHPAPADVEYYLCGPPLMSAAVRHMLDGLGVPPENIFFDDFGA
jgi:Na+-transporting NADH:ubiquinone oxidoreductase subunit F